MPRPVIIAVLAVLMTACGISQRAAGPRTAAPEPVRAYAVNRYDELEASLMQAYRDWAGTPYVLGGTSAAGVDCSSFVNIVYNDYFGIDLPGNTRGLLRHGDGVRRVSVRTGDLVFFRTGRRTLHVGIMVEEGDFLHASTSGGVTMSNINESYWANRYLGARRVF